MLPSLDVSFSSASELLSRAQRNEARVQEILSRGNTPFPSSLLAEDATQIDFLPKDVVEPVQAEKKEKSKEEKKVEVKKVEEKKEEEVQTVEASEPLQEPEPVKSPRLKTSLNQNLETISTLQQNLLDLTQGLMDQQQALFTRHGSQIHRQAMKQVYYIQHLHETHSKWQEKQIEKLEKVVLKKSALNTENILPERREENLTQNLDTVAETKEKNLVDNVIETKKNSVDPEIQDQLNRLEKNVEGIIRNLTTLTEVPWKSPEPVVIPTQPLQATPSDKENNAPAEKSFFPTFDYKAFQRAFQRLADETKQIVEQDLFKETETYLAAKTKEEKVVTKPVEKPIKKTDKKPSVQEVAKKRKPAMRKPEVPVIELKETKEMSTSPIRSASRQSARPPNFYNVKLSNAPVFLRRTTIRPPTLSILDHIAKSTTSKTALPPKPPKRSPQRSPIRSPTRSPIKSPVREPFRESLREPVVSSFDNLPQSRSLGTSIEDVHQVQSRTSQTFQPIEPTQQTTAIQTDIREPKTILSESSDESDIVEFKLTKEMGKPIKKQRDEFKSHISKSKLPNSTLEHRLAEWIQNEVLLRLLGQAQIKKETSIQTSPPKQNVFDMSIATEALQMITEATSVEQIQDILIDLVDTGEISIIPSQEPSKDTTTSDSSILFSSIHETQPVKEPISMHDMAIQYSPEISLLKEEASQVSQVSQQESIKQSSVKSSSVESSPKPSSAKVSLESESVEIPEKSFSEKQVQVEQDKSFEEQIVQTIVELRDDVAQTFDVTFDQSIQVETDLSSKEIQVSELSEPKPPVLDADTLSLKDQLSRVEVSMNHSNMSIMEPTIDSISPVKESIKEETESSMFSLSMSEGEVLTQFYSEGQVIPKQLFQDKSSSSSGQYQSPGELSTDISTTIPKATDLDDLTDE